MKTILGVDPGSHYTGFGVIQADGDRIRYIAHGVISMPASMAFEKRLHSISRQMAAVFETYRPDVTVVERIFLGRNADSAFKLGHVRGVCVVGALQVESMVVEYAARAVKKGITGNGAASKEHVQLIVLANLGIREAIQIDASDALALAYFHARNLEIEEAFARQEKPRRPPSRDLS